MIYFIFAVQFLKMQNVKCKYYQLIPFLTFDKDIDVACEQGFENKIRRILLKKLPSSLQLKANWYLIGEIWSHWRKSVRRQKWYNQMLHAWLHFMLLKFIQINDCFWHNNHFYYSGEHEYCIKNCDINIINIHAT